MQRKINTGFSTTHNSAEGKSHLEDRSVNGDDLQVYTVGVRLDKHLRQSVVLLEGAAAQKTVTRDSVERI